MNRNLFRKVFNQDEPNMKVITLLLFILSILSILLAIGIGLVSVHPLTVTKIIIAKLPFLTVENNWTLVEQNIVWGLRLPRVLLGMIVGASLAITGVVMQALVRNHLADPFILGVSSRASATATLGGRNYRKAFKGINLRPKCDRVIYRVRTD